MYSFFGNHIEFWKCKFSSMILESDLFLQKFFQKLNSEHLNWYLHECLQFSQTVFDPLQCLHFGLSALSLNLSCRPEVFRRFHKLGRIKLFNLKIFFENTQDLLQKFVVEL